MTNRMLPRLVTSATLVVGLFVAHRVEAQSVYFNGFTNGLFCSTSNVGCVNPNTSLYQTAALTVSGKNLRYVNAKFAGTSSNGTLILNGAATPFGTQNVNNFGAFYLAGGSVTYSSPFTLWLTFINPATTTLAYAALVSGTITFGQGTVNIAFNPSTQTQGFSYNSGNGWATVTVNNVGTPAEGTANVTGLITAAQVTPEPFTVSLVGTGLLGLAGMLRRRRRQNSA